MKLQYKLNQLNISQLRIICKKLNIDCSGTKKKIIERIIKPLVDKKYKMDGDKELSSNTDLVRYVKNISNIGIYIADWMFKWVEDVTNIIFPGSTNEAKFARKILYLWGTITVFIQMYYYSQMGTLYYEIYWSQSGVTVINAISEIISHAIIDVSQIINSKYAIESISCSLLQPEDTQELLDFIKTKSFETKTKTMKIINDRISILDENNPVEYWEKQELLTLPYYEYYVNIAQNTYNTISDLLKKKLPLDNNKMYKLPVSKKTLSLPKPNPCDPYTPDCKNYKNLIKDFFKTSRKYTGDMLDKINPIKAGRRHCVRNIKYVVDEGFNKFRTLPNDLITRAKQQSLQQQNKLENLKYQQQNSLPFLQLWAIMLVSAFIIKKLFGLNRNGNRNTLTNE